MLVYAHYECNYKAKTKIEQFLIGVQNIRSSLKGPE